MAGNRKSNGNGHTNGEAPEALNGGASAERLDKLPDIVRQIESAKQRNDDARSDLGDIYQSAEEDGFNRRALKEAVRLRNMEADKRRDYLASLNAYCDKLGIWAQGDLFNAEARPPQPEPAPPFDVDDDSVRAGARKLGRIDGLNGSRQSSHLYAQGTEYHADYELGFQEGQRQLAEKQFGPIDLATKRAGRRRRSPPVDGDDAPKPAA